jgi:leucyl aminopeptidase
MRNKKIKYNKEDLELAVKMSNTYVDVFRYLKLCTSNYKFLKQKILEYDIDVSHFNQSNSRKGKTKRTLNELLVKDGPPVYMSGLKQKLYEQKLKQPICEICSQGENWKGKKMSLILDHIDGDHYNNELNNLRIVCPNCNATLDTHCGKNKKRKNKKQEQELKEKIKKDKIELLKHQIIESGIDFTKKGWSILLGKKLNRSGMNALNLVRKHLPDIYKTKCFKHTP